MSQRAQMMTVLLRQRAALLRQRAVFLRQRARILTVFLRQRAAFLVFEPQRFVVVRVLPALHQVPEVLFSYVAIAAIAHNLGHSVLSFLRRRGA